MLPSGTCVCHIDAEALCALCRVGLASVTQLKTLKITAPLCDLSPREATRHSWSAAARIVNYAFSDTCLSSMPCLQNLTIDLQHINMRSARPVGEALQPPDSRASVSDDFCAWDLPSRPLKSLSLSGVALGDRQLNYKQTTKVCRLFNLKLMLLSCPSPLSSCADAYSTSL